MGKLIYLMGKSSVGKDTIYKKLLEKEPSLLPLTLYTTRPIRQGEVDGREYFFVTKEEKDRLMEAGKIIEIRSYHTINGIWDYFTVDDGQMSNTEQNYVGIGTLESYQKLKEYYGDEVLVPIYIELRDEERLIRAIEREKKQKKPNYAEVCRRFLADEADFSKDKICQAGIKKYFHSTSSEKCVEEIIQYIRYL